MGIIKRQSILNSIVTYIGIALGFITTLYLYPNILTQDQYGLTRLLLSVSFVCTQFAQLGMKNIAIKFFPYFQSDNRQHNGFLFWILLVPLAGFIIFTILFLGFESFILAYYQESSQLFTEYYLYLLPLVFSMVYFDVINSFIRALHDSIPGSLINEIQLRLLSILLLVLYSIEYIDFRTFMTCFVLTYFTQPVLLLFYLGWKGELNLKPDFRFMTRDMIKRIANFGTYAVLGGMAALLVNNIDIIMLGSLKGLSDTAIYAIAFYIGSVIAVPQRSIGKIAPSLLSSHLKNNNLDEVQRIYKSSSLNQLIAGCLLFIGIWANLHNLLDILPDKYSEAGLVIIIIGFSKLIDMAAGVNGAIILNSKFYRFDLLSTLMLVLLTIITNYILIPPYGIIGAAIATALSIFVYNLIKGIYVWVKFSMQPFSLKIIPLLLLCCALLWVSMSISRTGGIYTDLIIRSALISLIYSYFVISLNISDDITQLWFDLKGYAKSFFS